MKIGRYEVEAEIGRGAMGVVYLAVDPRLERRVAIKTYSLPDGLPHEQKREYQERFLREARAAACLSHPGIVTVFDSDEDEASGDPFIAMEYIEGRTLRDRLDEVDRFPADRAFEIAGVLAEALHTAHEAGVVHRDVKPANVIVREAGDEVKIADFGVARLPTSELTRTGATLGSPAYMSPEHITTGEVDARSDLFSLASILYEMLCGERPFQGDELAALAYSIVHENPIPVTKRVDGLSRAVDEFFDRALAKDPADRFPTGLEFAEALQSACTAGVVSDLESTLVDAPVTPVAKAESVALVVTTEPEAGPLSTGPIAFLGDDDEASPRPGAYPADDDEDERAETGSRRRRWLIACLLVLGMVVGARWVLGPGATVDLNAKSSVRSGTLTLTLDGREVFSTELAAGGPKSMRMLKKAVGIKEERFSESIAMGPGRHEFVARLETGDGGSEHRESLVVEVERGDRRTLHLSAGSAYGAPLSMRME